MITETELVQRYRLNYGIPPDVELTREQIQRHFDLERSLTEELLASDQTSRFDTFERCYSRLYSELPWLNSVASNTELGEWPALIGPAPRSIYEVGSGQGGLALALAAAGYQVEATEITRKRGALARDDARLRWGATDGVNLTQFARPSAYDAVVSNQVLEHLHPDDVVQHLREAHALLRPGGRYVLRTPHAFAGPHDISHVFGLERPVGMHLHEYDYSELSACMYEAGFAMVMAPFALPQLIRRRIWGVGVWPSASYLRYLLWAERVLRRLSRGRRKWVFTRLPKICLFRRDGMIVGVKSR